MAAPRRQALQAVLIGLAGSLIAGPIVAGLLLRSPSSGAGRRAIRQVLLRQQAAWNEGSLEEFMDGYWNSPDLTFVSGPDQTRGWEATLERYRKRYQQGGGEMGRLSFTDLDIEPQTADSALVHGRWRVVTTKETLGGRFILTFRKFPQGWRIVRDETSLDEKQARSAATDGS
jgi:beta-aspartyl-peptidase (threonine type)